MTLIITEISEFGIAMVADSAVTESTDLPSGGTVTRVLNGAKKLQAIPYLRAGISMWGHGSLKASNNWISTDMWVVDFIEQHQYLTTLDEFANKLAQELQNAAGNINEPIGFHLAGLTDSNGECLPVAYHVRNNDGDFIRGYELHEFIPGLQFLPKLPKTKQFWIIRNGDYGPYAILSQPVWNALKELPKSLDLQIPYPSLVGRIRYHKTWVRFISDLYNSSELFQTIGGYVTSLGIYYNGQMICDLG